MKQNYLAIFSCLTMVVWTACSDESTNFTSPDASGKSNNPKSQSSASDYNVSLSTDGETFTYTITKNQGAKNLGHFIVNLDNCGDQSPHLANILSATIDADGEVTPLILDDTEGWGTGCLPISSNFIKFDDLPGATVLKLSFTLDSKFAKTESTGWLKAGTSCNTKPIEAPGCPVGDCVYGLGHWFANGSGPWPHDVQLGGYTYTKAEGQALWYGGNDSNVALRAFFRYASLSLNGALDDAPQSAIDAVEAYFSGNANKLTQANINAGHFNNSGLNSALSTINQWIDENECD